MTFDPIRPTPPESATPADLPPFSPAAPEPSMVPPDPIGRAAPAMTAPSPASRRTSGRRMDAVLLIAAAVAIGGVAFAIGRGTAPTSAATGPGQIITGGVGLPAGSFPPGGAAGPRSGIVLGGPDGGGPTISGTVESVDGDTLTIETASGQTVKLKTDADTTYHAQAPASASDVAPGTSVQIQVEFDGAGGFRPGASAAASDPVGTAGSVTVVP